jgi:hypothetical protein
LFIVWVTITTEMNFALLAIGVGWAVAKAMRKASGGAGGRRYQIVAELLTYSAVSIAAVPTAIYYQIKQNQSHTDAARNATTGSPPEAKAKPSPGGFLLLLLGLGLAFLAMQNPMQGLIGLLIIFFGIRTAWRMMAGGKAISDEMSGPFPVSSGASA